MLDLINKIHFAYNRFEENAIKNRDGNKAAGGRARKISLELEKLFKQYRKLSLEIDNHRKQNSHEDTL